MKTETIIEGNKLIAEFMGLKPVKTFGKYLISQDHCVCSEETEEKAMRGFASIAKYNSSWNWLMPCIGKISNQCEEPAELDSLKYALLCNDINTAYEFVVDYISGIG